MLWNSLQLKIHTIDSIKHASLGRSPMTFITLFKKLFGEKLSFSLISSFMFCSSLFIMYEIYFLLNSSSTQERSTLGYDACNTSKTDLKHVLTIFVKIIWIKILVCLVCGSENDSLLDNTWKQQVVSTCGVFVDHDWIQPDRSSTSIFHAL